MEGRGGKMFGLEKFRTSKKILSLLFAGGVFLIFAAGIVWTISWKIKQVSAHEQSGASGSGSGEFSEEWVAQEIYGWYGAYPGATDENIGTTTIYGIGAALPRMDGIKRGSIVTDNGIPKQGVSYGINADGWRYRLFSNSPSSVATVTKWTVNGHIHP